MWWAAYGRMSFRLAPLFAALALSACATDYGAPINGQRALSPEEQRLQAVENKTVDLSRRLNALESTQNGSQADDMRDLRGQVEQLRHDVDTLQQAIQQQNADNAWYWMGESYHVKGDDANALKSYQSLLQQFPASPKVPDALLKTGVIYQGQQKNPQARDAYQKVLKQYPSSSAAAQARTRLAQLK